MKTFIIYCLLVLSCSAYATTDFVPQECTKEKIKADIKKLRYFSHESAYNFYTKYIERYSKKYNIHCEIPTILLRVESNFTIKENRLSGEISIAQINYDFWQPVFKKNFRINLNKEKLMKSNRYALKNMFVILNYLKKTYSKKDDLWFLRYNSNHLIHRLAYLKRFENFMYKIKTDKKVLNYAHKTNLLQRAVAKYGWKKVLDVYTLLDTKENKMKEYRANVKMWREKRERKQKKRAISNNENLNKKEIKEQKD